jgi:hypothetical protein
MKGILEEGAKMKKNYKQLELHLSYWLNLVYLENMMFFLRDHQHSIQAITPEVNHAILAYATMKLRTNFADVLTSNEFLQTIITKIEETIPNITFDDKIIELANHYHAKLKAKDSNMFKKKSTDTFGSFVDQESQRRYSSFGGSDSTHDESNIQSVTNRRTKGSEISQRNSGREEIPNNLQNINVNPFIIDAVGPIPIDAALKKHNLFNDTYGNSSNSSRSIKISLSEIMKDRNLIK